MSHASFWEGSATDQHLGQGMPDMLTLSNARDAVTIWSAALATSLLFVSAAIGPLTIA
jgi:hypothetical protein